MNRTVLGVLAAVVVIVAIVVAVASGGGDEDGEETAAGPSPPAVVSTAPVTAVATSTPAPVAAATSPPAPAAATPTTAPPAPAPTNTPVPPAPTATPTTMPAGGGALSVTISGFAYTPKTLTVQVGQPVSIAVRNNDGAGHTFTITGVVNSGTISGGDSETVSFTPMQAGTLTFFCAIHGQGTMSGTITVQ